MASSTKYHARSVSFPSRSHPSVARVEEQLNALRSLEISSASSNSNTLCTALAVLDDLYARVESLLGVGSTQRVISRGEHRDALLDASVRLLDACGSARDVLLETNAHVRELQSARRRSRNKRDSSLEASFSSYFRFRKTTKKEAKKLLATLKQVEKAFQAMTINDVLMEALREVCTTSVSVFQSLLSFLTASDKPRNYTRWSLLSKFVHKGAVACETDEEPEAQRRRVNEFRAVDSLLDIVSDNSEAQRRLEALEKGVDGVESCLESVFRRLIRIRASLLNMVSH